MANTYDKVMKVMERKPEQRQDFEIQGLLPWLRKKSKLFDTLKTDYLKDIVRNCSVRTYSRDDIIIRQGEIGDCFYIILGGKISIYIINKDKEGGGGGGGEGEERDAFAAIGSLDKTGKLDRAKLGNFVTYLGSGVPFGEVALVSEDAIRTASIIAEEDHTDLLVIDRSLYNRCVRDVLAAEFEEKTTFIKENELFRSWIPKYKKQLTMAMYKETFPFDSVLVKQGDPVENIYFVISGQVEIRTDPTLHPTQYPKLYALLEDEREKLIKEKRQKNQAENDNNPAHLSLTKKKENTKVIKLCYLGKNESLGEMEILLDMDTYMSTAVCTERTEVLVLEMKHYERLFVKKHQRTIDAMRRNTETKLSTRSSVLKEYDAVPLLKLIQMKLFMIHNPSNQQTEKKKKPQTSVQNAERLFFNHQGPLLDIDGPGSVFYMIRAREKSKLKMKGNHKEKQGSKQSSKRHHTHALRLPHNLVLTAQMAGATETEVKHPPEAEIQFHVETTGARNHVTGGDVPDENEIEAVSKHNLPGSGESEANQQTDYEEFAVNKAQVLRRVQSATKAKQNPELHRDVTELPNGHTSGAAEGTVNCHVKSLPVSRPSTRLEQYSLDDNVGNLEAKVAAWLRRDNPRTATKVSQLRRIRVEDMEPKPRPGNKIIVRKRAKTVPDTERSESDNSVISSDSGKVPLSNSLISRNEPNYLDRFKILLTS